MPFTGNERLITRQFLVTRLRNVQLSDSDYESREIPMLRHYAMVQLHYLEKELQEGLLIVRVNLPELNKKVEGIVNAAHIVTLKDLLQIVGKRKEELSNLLFERLVVEIDHDDNMRVVFDENIEGVSSEMRKLR